MLETGKFLGIIIEKVATSKLAGTLLSETSEDEETPQSKRKRSLVLI
jgi:hypothetical protein